MDEKIDNELSLPIIWKGDWVPAKVYKPGNVVFYVNGSFVALEINVGKPPRTNSTSWHIFAPQGTKGDCGVRPRGNWSNITTYGIGDLVQYGGSTYVCIMPHQTKQEPATGNTNYWNLVASKGKPGDVGPKGDKGVEFKGYWSEFETYMKDDLVSDGVQTYISVIDNNNTTPAENQLCWNIVAARGAEGPLIQFVSTLQNNNNNTTTKISRPLMEKLSDVVSVLDFGAKANSNADSTFAFENAIQALSLRGGGCLFIPVGQYVVNAIRLDSMLVLRGETFGACVLVSTTTPRVINGTFRSSMTNISLENLTFTTTTTTTNLTNVKSDALFHNDGCIVSDLRIQSCIFNPDKSNVDSIALDVPSSTPMSNVWITDNEFPVINGAAVNIYKSNTMLNVFLGSNNHILNNKFGNCSASSFAAISCNNPNQSNFNIAGNTFNNSNIHSNGICIAGNSHRIENNIFMGSFNKLIDTEMAAFGMIVNGNKTKGKTDGSVIVSGFTDGGTFSNNTFHLTQGVTVVGNSDSSVVNGNTFTNRSNHLNVHAVLLKSGNNIRFEDNIVKNGAMNLEAGVQNLVLEKNQFISMNPMRANYIVATSNTTYTKLNNRFDGILDTDIYFVKKLYTPPLPTSVVDGQGNTYWNSPREPIAVTVLAHFPSNDNNNAAAAHMIEIDAVSNLTTSTTLSCCRFIFYVSNNNKQLNVHRSIALYPPDNMNITCTATNSNQLQFTIINLNSSVITTCFGRGNIKPLSPGTPIQFQCKINISSSLTTSPCNNNYHGPISIQ